MTVYKDCKNCGSRHHVNDFAYDKKTKSLKESCRTSNWSIGRQKGAETHKAKKRSQERPLTNTKLYQRWI